MIMTLRKCGEKMSEQLSVAKDIKALALINIQDIFRFTITATDKEIEDRYGSEARAIEVAEKYLEIAMRTSVLEYDLNGWSVTYSVPIKGKNERIEKTAYFYDKADHKDEPTISKMEQVDKDINVRSKTEPQTNAGQHVQHVESVESIQTDCDTCLYKDTYDEWEGNCDECEDGSEYTPQTERSK